MVDSFGGFRHLPIRKRGGFTKDDFFKDFQNDFDSAIQNVMDRHSGRSLLADQFSLYRKMRENTQDAGPAASVSETKDSTVIVLDMSDFVKGSMSVKTRGRYIVVEANYESRSFSRKFLLPPNTNFDGVKTAMSNEGILTIIAPKKGTQNSESPKQNEPTVKLDLIDPDSFGGGSSTSTETTVTSTSEKEEPEPSSPTAGPDRRLSISQKGNFFQDQYFENVWKDFETAMDEMVQKEEEKRAQKLEQKRQERKELADKLKNDMFMDAEKKQKDFFEKAFRKESLSEFGIPKLNRLNSYRNLRSWAPETETQAYTITKDENGYKIIMDVKNFSTDEGDVSVKATEGSVTVTGRKGPLNFQKEFTLPGLTNPDQIVASVSEDGILTITANV